MSGSSSRSSGRLGRPLNSIRLTAWPRRTSSSGTSSPSSASPAAYDATHAAARSGRSSASCRPIWMSPTSSWDRSNPTGWDRQKPKSISVNPGSPARRSRLLGQASPCEARWRDVANSWARTSRWRAAARRPSRRPPKCSATAGWSHVASSCRPGSTVKARPTGDEAVDVPGLRVDVRQGGDRPAGGQAPEQAGRADAVVGAPRHRVGVGGLHPDDGGLVGALLDPQPAGHREPLGKPLTQVGAVDQRLGAPRERGGRPLADLGRYAGEGGGVPPVVHPLDEQRELPALAVGAGVRPGGGTATDPRPGAGEDRRDVVGDGLGRGVVQPHRRHVPQVGDHRLELGVADVVGAEHLTPVDPGRQRESCFHGHRR